MCVHSKIIGRRKNIKVGEKKKKIIRIMTIEKKSMTVESV
jgi:hypothetical protein